LHAKCLGLHTDDSAIQLMLLLGYKDAIAVDDGLCRLSCVDNHMVCRNVATADF
jgi:hypothetical protein